MQNDARPRAHAVSLENRESLRISGVEGVDCFNEELVVLATALGQLTVSGSGLHMRQLDLEQGRVEVGGQIDALEYSGQAARGGGFLARLLR